MSNSVHYYHCVWATKYRRPWIKDAFRMGLFDKIKKIAKEHRIDIMEMDGGEDHLHILVRCDPDMKVADMMRLLKGTSSRWANKEGGLAGDFQWQKSYFSRSLSYKDLNGVRSYIRDQHFRHGTISFPPLKG